jgi:DNA-binding PadR family transcriptional regulator
MPRVANSSPQTCQLLAALLARAHDWRHGYDLSKETGLKSGTLYPLLIRLEGDGWLQTHWEEPPMHGRPARHLYRLTPRGETAARSMLRAKAQPVSGVRLSLSPKEART